MKPALYDEKRESKMKRTTMLKKNYEFRNVLTKGRKYSGKYIEIYIKRNYLNENKLGIAISSKIANSVNRNKIKRLIRENYRLAEDDITTGNTFVILWKKNKSVEDANFFSIKQDINQILEQANLKANN